MKLADYFDTSVDYLIGYTDIPHKIEPVSPHERSSAESELLERYRRLSPKQKQCVSTLFEAFTE